MHDLHLNDVVCFIPPPAVLPHFLLFIFFFFFNVLLMCFTAVFCVQKISQIFCGQNIIINEIEKYHHGHEGSFVLDILSVDDYTQLLDLSCWS